MNILAVDTAGKTLGVALLQDDRLKYECYLDGGMTHSETLMPLVDHCLKLCGLTCADIDLFGVNAGPGSFTGLRRRKMAALFTRMICADCDAVIAPTPKISRLLAGYGVHCPVRIIPTGLDLQRFAVPRDDALRSRLGLPPKEANKTVLLSLGRLAKEKNTTELVDSMQNLPDAVLLIVGDGPERAVLEQQAQSLGVADRVIFVGAVPPAEVPRYYALGDVFVSASTSEAQGLTYIEAMAAGLPLLCHADPCLDALVREGETGWAYHTPAELAARAAALPKGHQLAAMRQNARRAVQPYTKEQFGLSVVRLYAAALGRKHAARSAAGGNVA